MRHLSKSGIVTLQALGGPIGSRTAQVQEQQLEETKFIAFFMGKKIDIEGKDLYDAKQKAITQLKVPKSKVGLLAVVSAESQKNQDFRFESVNEGNLSWAWTDRYAKGISNLTQIDTKDVKKFIEDNKLNIEKIFAIVHKTSQGKTDFVKAIKAAPNSSIQKAYIKTYTNESVNEGKKAFKVNPGIGKAKYSISSHDGVKKHKDGSDFWDIEIFKNKVDLEKAIKNYSSKGFVKENIENVANGLPQTMGKQKSLKREALKSIVREVMQEEAEYQKFFQKVLDKAGKSIPSMSDDEKKAFFNKVDAAWSARGEKNESVVNEEALPKDGSTIKINNIPVKIEYVSNGKYIGYSWKGKHNKENYEETKVSNHSNLNSLIKAIKVNL
jgi:hypothetical protein